MGAAVEATDAAAEAMDAVAVAVMGAVVPAVPPATHCVCQWDTNLYAP